MGARRYFGTDGIRGVANMPPMDPQFVLDLGRCLAFWVKSEASKASDGNPKVLIGKDTRISGYMLENALTAGLCSMGIDVLLVGPMPTPAVAHLTRSFAADAGVMISASHNPAEDNGIKIFDSKGLKLTDSQELEIEKLLAKPLKSEGIIGSRIGRAKRIDDARGRYIEFVKSSIQNSSLKGLDIALDCANGAAYAIAADIFRELGAKVSVINDKPDGLNINLQSGALYPEKVRDVVVGHYKNIGISLDGDADRVIFVDDKGAIIDGDAVLFIISSWLKENNKLNQDTIVATIYSNKALDSLLIKKGICVKRVACGDRYVLESILANGYSFGGESSGHLIFKEYSTTGDGILAALQILHMLKAKKMKLSELVKPYTPFPQVLKNTAVSGKIPLDKLPKTTQLIQKIEKELGKKGRVFVRYSGTENKVRILVEGTDQEEISWYAEKISCSVVEESASYASYDASYTSCDISRKRSSKKRSR